MVNSIFDKICENCVHSKVCKYKNAFEECRSSVIDIVDRYNSDIPCAEGFFNPGISCREFKPKDAVVFRQTVIEKKELNK